MPDDQDPADGALLVPQMLFGTFRRESGGYRIVCRSPGVSEAMARGAKRQCEAWGSCIESGFAKAVVHQILNVTEASGEPRLYFLAIRVTNLGTDQAGRPGALCFHVLFFEEDAYARVAFEPFLLDRAGLLVGDWDGRDSWPPLYVEPGRLPAATAAPADGAVLTALRQQLLHLLAGHPVRFAARLPTTASDEHVALLFRLTPWSARRRMAAASFTFSSRRDYALAVEHSDQGRLDLLRPQPLPSLPHDLPPGVTAYVDDLLEALRRHDLGGAQALARSAKPHAVQPPPTAEPARRSLLGRLFGGEGRTT